jgi:hypothetical protein
MNHWWIRKDVKDNYGNIVKEPSLPDLRDNEWIRGEAFEQCRIQLKGYMEIGLRQGGKSEMEASITGYNALMFKNTQNVIVGGNNPDLDLLKDKIDFGLKSMWEGLAIPRIDKDWRKPMVKLGFKNKSNEDDIWSYLVIRNADEGRNTEAPAGTTAKSFVMDEVGKYPFGPVFAAAKEAFISQFGWRTIPVLVGTGGSFEKGEHAERFFYNPDANNFLAFVDPETGKRTCLFLSGLYRQDCKVETNLFDWLVKERGLEIADGRELEKIIIRVADKEKALQVIKDEREKKAKDPDQTEYYKAIMYHPLNPEECFLSVSSNIYNVHSAKRQQRKIRENGYFGTPVILEHDGEKIVHEFTEKKPISSYPTGPAESKDAPIVVWEFPMEQPPFGLYVAGVDPYRQGKAEYSTSLGSVYIYKRMHDIGSEKYQDMFVASYVARPDDPEVWNEQARLLIKYYNARTLCENDEMGFINYMIYKGDGHYLEDQPGWLKEIAPTSGVKRPKGIHRSNERIRDYLHATLKNYLNEVVHRETNEDGSVISEHLGVSRVLDLMLLEEIIKFNPDEGNYDREVAASLAIALAKHLDPQIRVSTVNTDPRYVSYFKKNKKGSSVFNKGGSRMFSKTNTKLFKK